MITYLLEAIPEEKAGFNFQSHAFCILCFVTRFRDAVEPTQTPEIINHFQVDMFSQFY